MLEALGTAEGVQRFEGVEQGGGAQFGHAVIVQMIAGHQYGQFAVVFRRFQALAKRFDQRYATGFVGDVFRPLIGRGNALAQIMKQGGETNLCFGTEAGRLFQHHQSVQAGVDFRMIFFHLRHAEQAVDFREQYGQRAAVA